MFQKRICTKIISLLLVIGCLMSEPVLAEKQKEPEAQTLYSKSCAMVDGDSGRLLYGKEAQTALPNASTTKILTMKWSHSAQKRHHSRRYISGRKKENSSICRICGMG